MIPKGIANPHKVLEGFWNEARLENGSLTDDETYLVMERRAICETCPFSSNLAKTSEEYKALMGENYKTDLKFNHCSICSCKISAKTACLSCKCGMEEYNKENPNNKQIIKW